MQIDEPKGGEADIGVKVMLGQVADDEIAIRRQARAADAGVAQIIIDGEISFAVLVAHKSLRSNHFVFNTYSLRIQSLKTSPSSSSSKRAVSLD